MVQVCRGWNVDRLEPRELADAGREQVVRAFVAIALAPEARQFCADALERVRSGLGSVSAAGRWVDPAALHLTVKFLGAVPTSQVPILLERLQARLRGQIAFELAIGRLGVFPNPRAPRVLWLDVLGDRAALGATRERVEVATEPLGYPREKRPFQPHLTLGRVREATTAPDLAAIGRLPAAWPDQTSEPFRVESLEVMRSELGPGGAKYTRLAELRFGA